MDAAERAPFHLFRILHRNCLSLALWRKALKMLMMLIGSAIEAQTSKAAPSINHELARPPPLKLYPCPQSKLWQLTLT